MEFILEAKALSKIYKSKSAEVRAVDAIDLQIARGDYVAIMGPSGSGKSTLLQILGLLDRPTSGAYKLLGRDVSRLTDDEGAALRSRTIGFIFQMFNLLPRTTAQANVELPMIYANAPGRPTRARELLSSVGLGGGAGEQVEHLEEEPDGSGTEGGAFVVGQTGDVPAQQFIGAGGRAVQEAQNLQQRGFARSRRPHDGHVIATGNL
jgi:predicted ABC-type transport system involved in lysophospholipase L1 biosynthesis ATPase subunit